MYNMPDQFGAFDHLCPLTPIDLNNCINHFSVETYTSDVCYFELCENIIQEFGWQKTKTVQNKSEFYVILHTEIRQLLA